jgi:hypothetical protein
MNPGGRIQLNSCVPAFLIQNPSSPGGKALGFVVQGDIKPVSPPAPGAFAGGKGPDL